MVPVFACSAAKASERNETIWVDMRHCPDLSADTTQILLRRLEVVVDGLPLFGGAQMAVDTTLFSTFHGDGSARRRAGRSCCCQENERDPLHRVGGPSCQSAACRLGVEVGGRWSGETQRFVSLLARAKARCEVWLLRRRAEQAWRLRWGSLLSCTVVRFRGWW